MVRRILSVSIVQAVRSVALTLLPAAFISLFAWATAGSATGNTTDPIRASVWIWLAAHQVPFHLASGKLSILPLGALIFPIWAIRKSFPRVAESHSKVEGARFFFALVYAAIATGLAAISGSNQIHALWYLAPAYAFVISYLATYNFKSDEARHIRCGFHVILLVWGIASLAIMASLIAHWRVLVDLDTVIGPGIIGGILFLLVQILYLPNAALYALSYALNVGFHLGSGTLIAPTHFTLHEIPALPILSTLPTGQHPMMKYGVAGFLVIALVIAIPVLREFRGFKARIFFYLRTSIVLIGIVAALCYLSSGELLTASMSPVGIPLVRFVEYFAIALGAIGILFIVLPAIVQRLRGPRESVA